jgi:hypothetical protein
MLIRHAVAVLALATTLSGAPAAAPAHHRPVSTRPACALAERRGIPHGCWRPQNPARSVGARSGQERLDHLLLPRRRAGAMLYFSERPASVGSQPHQRGGVR